MRLDCLIGNHKPLPPSARNQGFQFTCCRGCGRDMVRSGQSWRRVPRGFRVVWRQPTRPAPSAPGGGAAKRNRLPAFGRRPQRGFRAFAGILDLVRAALRVLLWSWHDRINGLRLWMRALPVRSATPLRLPSA